MINCPDQKDNPAEDRFGPFAFTQNGPRVGDLPEQ